MTINDVFIYMAIVDLIPTRPIAVYEQRKERTK